MSPSYKWNLEINSPGTQYNQVKTKWSSWLTLCNPMNCSLPGSSVYGILQTRILEWVVIPFSMGSSQPRDWIQISCTAGRFFTIWATNRQVNEMIINDPRSLLYFFPSSSTWDFQVQGSRLSFSIMSTLQRVRKRKKSIDPHIKKTPRSSTQNRYLYPTNQNFITWPYLATREAGKCGV